MRQCEALLREIAAEAAATAAHTGKPRFSDRVMAAVAGVPRHTFVPPPEETCAYVNAPLPIGYGQTISQPYMVALMTDLLEVRQEDVVLEVGTGSGYQAAVLSKLVRTVYTVELIGALAEQARLRLLRLGCHNVHVRAGDGHDGWPEHAPYDGILVTAAAATVPPALVAQLKAGRRIVLPVGASGDSQTLVVVEKNQAGEVCERPILPVAFVPLTRRNATDRPPATAAGGGANGQRRR